MQVEEAPLSSVTNLRTRESGRHRFVSLTVLVPGDWTVERGHTLADSVEVAIAKDLADTDVQTHLEPRPPHWSVDALRTGDAH